MDGENIQAFEIAKYTPYQVDDVLHALLEARHSQLPPFELRDFLQEHLMHEPHQRLRAVALRRLGQKLLVVLAQALRRQQRGFRPLFQEDDVFRHIMKPCKIVLASTRFMLSYKA